MFEFDPDDAASDLLDTLPEELPEDARELYGSHYDEMWQSQFDQYE